MKRIIIYSSLALLTMLTLAACSQGIRQPSSQDKLMVVATTSIVGDVVAQVGGELVVVDVLLPVGTDPHGFDPTPQDIAKVTEADVIIANGAGLEEFLDNLIESAGAADRVVYLSEGVDFLMFEGEEHEDEGEEHQGEEHEHQGIDPHIWTNPNNVMVWVDAIEHKLNEADPENTETYQANAEAYLMELKELADWIREQVAQVPAENRKLVNDHAVFGYFADEYGFEQVGALVPGYSSLSEPSAQELAAIEDAIQELDVKAVFVGNTVNPALAQRVAADTGTQLVFVYSGSLSKLGGDADSYVAYMRYNTSAFVDALK